MSAVNEREISHIRDEDVLKKMWQDTEDFGRKKEIRAHMYKLREARLKDLYCNSDVKDIQITTNSKSSFNQSTHADSLADHSFASLKSKEIRDSESPTRDVSYRITGSVNNQGWNVSKIDEVSQDGKTHKIIQSAETSGTEVIPKGRLEFQARNQQAATSFQDGDDKNFTRSQEVSSNTHVSQEASGGDDHSSFRNFSTKSSSSSKTVTEKKTSSEDVVDRNVSTRQVSPIQDNVISKTVKVYTTDVPKELKSHPGFVEGHTKVTRETKTLADGTIITTSKYETTGANETLSSSSNQFTSSSSRDEKFSSQKTSKDYRDTHERNEPKSKYWVEKTHTIPDTTNISTRTSHEQNRDFKSSSNQNASKRYEILITDDATNYKTENENNEEIITRKTKGREDVKRKNIDINERRYVEDEAINTGRKQHIDISERRRVEDEVINTGRKQHQKTSMQDINSIPLGAPIEIEIDVSKITISDDKRDRNTNYFKNETSRTQTHERKVPEPQVDIVYDVPQRKEPVTSSPIKTKPTDGQYETTYRTDFTNKRISVDVSPTHDAFARSLRAVSPDRLTSRTSSRNLKNSNTSLRSSSSPEKTYADRRHASRMSPDRQPNGRCYSPTKKTPDRFSSTETITYKSKPGSERNSPEKLYKSKYADETRVTTNYSTDTITKKRRTSDDTTTTTTTTRRKTPTRDTGYYKTTQDMTTDAHYNITKQVQIRPSTLDYSSKDTKKPSQRSPTSPVKNVRNNESPKKEHPKKSLPADRPLKRTDTYEERCRQILGITNETNERRRSSLEKLKRRGSSTLVQTETFTKTVSPQQPKNTTRESSPTKKSEPTKHKSPIREFPAQIRKTPEKLPSEKTVQPSPSRASPKKTDSSYISEYPSQIRKSPDKHQYTNKSSPSRELPERTDNKFKDSSHLVKQDVKISRTRVANSYVNEENVSSETLDQRKLGRQSPKDTSPIKKDTPDKCKPIEAREHIYEEIAEIKTKVTDKPSQEFIRFSPEPSPLREYPSQRRKSPEKPVSDEIFITEEIQEVIVDFPKENLPKQSRKSPGKEEPNISTSIELITDEYDVKRQPQKKNIKDVSGTVSITELNISVCEENPITGQPENKRTPKPDAHEENISKSKQKNISTYRSETVIEDLPKETLQQPSGKSPFPTLKDKEPKKNIANVPYREMTPDKPKYKPGPQKIFSDRADDIKQIVVSETVTTSVKDQVTDQNIREKKKVSAISDEIQTTREDEISLNEIVINQTQDSCERSEKPQNKVSHKNVPYSYPTDKPSLPQKPLKEVPKATRKPVDHPKPRKVTPEYSSDEEIEEVHEKKYVTESYEGRTPVEEPLMTKKNACLLYSDDDEDDIKKTQLLIESEITDRQTIVDKSKPKPEKTQKTATSKFIVNEKQEIKKKAYTPTKSHPQIGKKPDKKPLVEKNQNGPVLVGETEYMDKYNRKIIHLKDDNKEKNTLSDIENFDSLKDDNTIHVRTHRIDDSNKKITTSKTEIDQRTNRVLHKKPVTTRVPSSETVRKRPLPSHQTTVEKQTQEIVTKTKTSEPVRFTPKLSKVPQKRVTATPAKPKAETKPKSFTPKTKNVQQKISQKEIIRTIESDDESLPDSLNEPINDDEIDRKNDTSNVTVKTYERQIPSRSHSKPELLDHKPKTPKPKLEKRCISTKSIVINNNERGITVDLQRSVSSREPTPDRVCPLPVTSDEDGFAPRYPDKVVEPDDGAIKKKPTRLFDTSIQENEDGKEIHKIMELTEGNTLRVTDIDKVDKDDDSLLTVNKKIDKFLNTVEKLTEKPIVDISQPAPKVGRPRFDVGEDLKEDDCLLSVSDKVNKFITEAEHLTSQKNNQQKTSKNINIKSDVSKKINKFTTKVNTDISSPRKPSTKNIVTDLDEETEFVSTPNKLEPSEQSKPERFSKVDQDVFITTECTQLEMEEDSFRTSKPSLHPKEPKAPSALDTPEFPDTTQNQTQPNFVEKDSPRVSTPTKRVSSVTTTTTKKTSNVVETDEESPRNKMSPRTDSFKEFTPKNRRPSQEEKVILSTIGRLRSSESIKKAKAIFDKSESTKKEVNRQKDISNRSSVFEGRQITTKSIDRSHITPKRLDFYGDDKPNTARISNKPPRVQSPENHAPEQRSSITSLPKQRSSPDRDVPGYMKPLDRSLRPQSPHKDNLPTQEFIEDEVPSSVEPEESVPGYMKPLDRSFRPHSPKKDVPSSIKSTESLETPTKFGVTLKKTDSSNAITSTGRTTTTTKKHPAISKTNITEEDIEQIYDLHVLEELLLKLTGYELRRKIRTQIRIVRKLITENKLEITIQNIQNKIKTANQLNETTQNSRKTREYQDKYTRKSSPQRIVIDNKQHSHTNINDKTYNEKISEYKSTYTRKESVSSRSGSPGSRSSISPERKSPERKLITRLATQNIVQDKTNITNQSTYKKTDKKKNEETVNKATTMHSLKKTQPKGKPPITNGQPEWVSHRNLRKVGEGRTTTTSSSSSTSVKKQTIRSSSPAKEVKSTDIITSSYGVGPTDENGTPLFGLRALRAQKKAENTKVQGTVISSQYYSETGKEPIGQISVTKYSSDPRDLELNGNESHDDGILSVTTTQKFGFDDAPSLKQLTSSGEEICDVKTNKRTTTSGSSTMVRRNSVKALTQKFVENAAEESRNERQSSYPKAGLILRSSSFKNDTAAHESDDSDIQSTNERLQESVSLTTSSTKIVSGGTFLRNKSKVTGVQDVITRMKTEDVEDDDTEEDVEAKGLLNKYLGTQVILSGIEGHVSKTSTATARATSCSSSSKSTTKVTTVTMENGKKVTKTQIFEHPISDEVLENVWDEQTLRYLLDQSTDYEERKRIRSKLRLVMAEQEACTELVKQASQDQSSQSIDESIETSKKIGTEGSVTSSKVTTRVTTQQQTSKKPLSPFAKFRQLDKQNSLNTPPSTPRTPGGSPLFTFTDAALSQSANTIKDRLLHWCRMKTKEYENIQLENFSTSWADGLAFCALIHHFLPEAFDYHALTPKERRHNFTLAFKVADEKADIAPLLDVDDMVATRRPDWKCVFTYVQSIYRRFKDED